MESKQTLRILTALAILALLAWLIYLLRDPLVPVFTALFLAYLLDPLIDKMEKVKVNRSAAIAILAILVIGIAGSAGGFLVVQIQQELVALYNDLPGYIEKVQTQVVPAVEDLTGIELPHSMDEAVNEIQAQLQNLDPAVLKPVTNIITQVSSSTLTVISWLIGLLIIPVFLFYFLRDWDRITERIAGLVPVSKRQYVIEKAKKIDEILGAFIRGQLTIAVILGILYSIGLVSVGIDLAVVIGMGAGIAFIVPYLGTILGIVAASVMALLEFGLSWQLVAVWGVFGVVQLFEGSFLTPKIMGGKVGLSPVAVIFSLLVGAELLGLTGMLVAVPVAAVLNVFIGEAIEKYRASSLMQEGDGKLKMEE